MPDKSYYETLGLTKEADEAVIKAAYKALAQKYHPDKSSSKTPEENSTLMSDINKAYSVLGDVDKRKKYDLGLISAQYKTSSHPYKGSSEPRKPQNIYKATETESKPSQLGTIIFLLLVWAAGFYYIFVTVIKK